MWFRKEPFLMRDRLKERQKCNNRWIWKDYLSQAVCSRNSQEKVKTEYLCGFRHLKPTRGASLSHYWLGGLKGGLELQQRGSLMLISEEDSWWRQKEEEGYDAESQDRAIKTMLPRRLWTCGTDNRGRRQVVSECSFQVLFWFWLHVWSEVLHKTRSSLVGF